MAEDEQYYVYAYLDPRKPGDHAYGSFHFQAEPFYIGKGKGKRVLAQLDETRKIAPARRNKIRKILREVGKVKIVKVAKGLTNQEAIQLERKLIKLIGRYDLKKGPLLNFTDGGEGLSGFNHSKEAREKMGRPHRGKPRPREQIEKANLKRIGKKHSVEHRQKISDALKGNTHTLGYKWSDEVIEKRAAANRGKKKPQSFVERMKGNTHTLGYKHSEESCQKMKVGKCESYLWSMCETFGIEKIHPDNFEDLMYKLKNLRGLKRVVSLKFFQNVYGGSFPENVQSVLIQLAEKRATTIERAV